MDEFIRRRAAKLLRNLEATSINHKALRSQISWIRDTINRVLKENTTHAERFCTLLREQVFTITSIVTALGSIISTLVLAITGGAGGPPPPSNSGGCVTEWAKKYLQSLGQALIKLAGKAAGALSGIIGGIVSWLFNFLAKAAGWLEENLWTLALVVAGLLYTAARAWLASCQGKCD